MTWNEIRALYPDQWLVVEALGAQTTLDGKRVIRDLEFVEKCESGTAAFQAYRRHHLENLGHEYYYFHTSRIELDIIEERWLGIRIPVAAVD